MTDYRTTLIADEGLRLDMYKCSGDKWTIGVGHNLEAKGISEKVAMMILDEDIRDASRDAVSLVEDFYSLSDNRRIVLVSMVFQLGKRGVSNFKNMIQAINIGAFNVASAEMLDSRWATQTPARARRLSEMMKRG